MLDPATQAKILQLHFGEKLSQRAIAFQTGVHRRTVASVIGRKQVQTDRITDKKSVSILEPYFPLIEGLLRADISRSAINILQKLRTAGYQGGLTILKDHLRALRPGSMPPAYLSLEFLAGQAAQVDWGEFPDIFGLGRKLYCFVMVLCFSRMLYLRFTHSANFQSFIRCHEKAFGFFGAIPQEIWYDNLATAVAERKRKLVRFHPPFFTYAGYHGFKPIACNPASGNEKGRVEDGVRYIRHNFWPGRSFVDMDDLNQQAINWQNEFANKRVHATTRKIPQLLFDQEKQNFRPLREPFDTDEIKSLKVSHQFRISFDGNEYSVPWRMAGRIVTVRADEKCINVFYHARRISGHPRCWAKGQSIVNKDHENGLRDIKPGAQPDADINAVKSLGPHATSYLEMIPAQTNSIRSELNHLMVLTSVYGAQAVEAAIAQALALGIVGSVHIERLLDLSGSQQKQPPPLRLSDPRLCIPGPTPNLKSYDALLLDEEEIQGDCDARTHGST